MSTRWRWLLGAAGLAALCWGCGPEDPLAGASPRLRLAPLSARYLAHRPGVGHAPPPVDLSHVRGGLLPPTYRPLAHEAKYDMRPLGHLTPIRDQLGNKSCWTFPPMAALESALLPGERWDFSEDNLRCKHGFDHKPLDGGNALMATAYLARTGGPVSEQDDPYPTVGNAPCTSSPDGLAHRKRVTQVILLPDRKSNTDNDVLKAAVKKYGPIATCMDARSGCYLPIWKSFYNPWAVECSHMVNIIGWDDTFSGHGFKISAPGDGAFIIRNSWGEDWGEGGYGYVSYYDDVIGSKNYAFNAAVNSLVTGRVYQHDPLGWINSVGYNKPEAWMANMFTALATEPLHSVSFYATSPGATYSVAIHDGVSSSPTGGTQLGQAKGQLTQAGYHTVDLSAQKITLTAGHKFSVVVKVTTPGHNSPVPVEVPLANYSSEATAAAGQSFVSADGEAWDDLTSLMAGGNVCVKAFAGTLDPTRSCGEQTYDGKAWTSKPRAAGTPCRASRGPCDLAEACDGSSTSCPADGFRSATTVCRPAAGPCDAAEVCSGAAAACPSDRLLSAGAACRAAAGECDAPETCSGAALTCPADQIQTDGAPCMDGRGSCLAGACVPSPVEEGEGGCSWGGPPAPTGLPWALLLLVIPGRRVKGTATSGVAPRRRRRSS